MYPVYNAFQNIFRQHKRYRILVPLIIVIAVLTGIYMTIAVPCRQYSELCNTFWGEYSETEAAEFEAQNDRVRELGETASLLQFSIMLIGAIAILYTSSLLIGERMLEIGILYAVGLSGWQIFIMLFIELATVCGGTLILGLDIGKFAAERYLIQQVETHILPVELLKYMGNGMADILCFIVAVGILLLPITGLVIKMLLLEPNDFFRERK